MTTDRPIECKKDGLRQCQDGTWKLSLTVHPNDMPTSLMTAAMGTRYAVALVEIGDDEEPVEPVPQQDKPSGEAAKERSKGGRRAWSELPPSQQAGMACRKPQFQLWVKNKYASARMYRNDRTDEWLRDFFKIESRSELDHDETMAWDWQDMYARYLQDTGQQAEERG